MEKEISKNSIEISYYAKADFENALGRFQMIFMNSLCLHP